MAGREEKARDLPVSTSREGRTTGLVRRLLADRRFRFLLVGGINVLQGIGWFAVFYPLVGDRIPYIAVLVLVYAISIPIGFVLYRTLVFRVAGQWLTDLARFTLVQAMAFLINLGSLPFFHEVLGVPLLIAQALSIGVILVFNYTGHLYFSFRRRHGHPDAGRIVEPYEVVSPVGPGEREG